MIAYDPIMGLFDDLVPAFVPTARGTASKKFVVRIYALTDGDEIAVADSKPLTLFSARRLEVRARKSDALDVAVYEADSVPPAIEDAKRITSLVGIHITVDKDLIDLMLTSPRSACDDESTQRRASSPEVENE